MNNPKEMPAPCKDEHTSHVQVKSSKNIPRSQVNNWQPIGAVVARVVSHTEEQIAYRQHDLARKLGLPIGAIFPSRTHLLKPSPQVCLYATYQSQNNNPKGGSHAERI
tara:strand:+ start:600 stop:923 length:324 start_codon:yes stop_codon:yes gene_type:complete